MARGNWERGFMSSFNLSQIAAVSHGEGACLVLAGPGSGKTTVLTHRIKSLIDHGVKASKILVVTFTKASALEMQERFFRLFEDGGLDEARSVSFGTFHAIFFHILKASFGFDKDSVISDSQKRLMLKDVVIHFGIKDEREDKLIGEILDEMSLVKSKDLDIDGFESKVMDPFDFRKVFKELSFRMESAKKLDFDDMQKLTLKYFNERPGVLKKWQGRYEYILVDEFQDISPIQYELLKALSHPEDNLFAVGDDDQSIYGFRGSSPRIMLGFEDDFEGAVRILLDTNYRCGREIVESSLRLISHNKERFEKEISAGRKDEGGVFFEEYETPSEEAGEIAKKILEINAEGVPLSNMAILFRVNSRSTSITRALVGSQIPFSSKKAPDNIYEHWIFKDIFSYIRLSLSPEWDRADILRILNRPVRGLSREYINQKTILPEKWLHSNEGREKDMFEANKLYMQLKMMGKMRPYAAVNFIRHGMGYEEFVLSKARSDEARDELIQILDFIQYDSRDKEDINDWERYISDYSRKLSENVGASDCKERDAVTLATMHGAKGLEYDTVFIIDANEKICPYDRIDMETDTEEERRLFYVGMTRAKNRLYISHIKRMGNHLMYASRFIKEVKDS